MVFSHEIGVNDNEEEVFLHVNKPCTIFEEKFSHNEYTFGGDSNTTFYVYVFDFTTPFIVEVSPIMHIDYIEIKPWLCIILIILHYSVSDMKHFVDLKVNIIFYVIC